MSMKTETCPNKKCNEVYNLISEAKDILWDARNKGILRHSVYIGVLRGLKRELKKFNMQTGEWNNEGDPKTI